MTHITTLTRDFKHSIDHNTITPDDPTLSDTWTLCESLTHLAGTRLLEKRFGANIAAGDEVLAYLWHFRYVTQVSCDAPVRVPREAVRVLQRVGIMLEHTKQPELLTGYLLNVRTLSTVLNEHATAQLGKSVRPLADAFHHFQQASEVFEASLCRTTPHVETTQREV